MIQKYGGTSVGSIERIEAVADRVTRMVQEGHQIGVVVSAMGHSTDELVAMAHQISTLPDSRELDALLSTGEQVSASLLAMALQRRGISARSMTGWQAGIEAESVFGAARIVNMDTSALRGWLEQGAVPVITGFQGITEEGDIVTLGRGGSDTTAVAVAAALQADLCEIYTDVTGVYTTDPRVVKNAKKLDVISYDEMLELANLGAQVLHPRAVENAKQFQVKLVVRSSFSEEEGTLVQETATFEQRHVVTGIAFEREVSRVSLLGVAVQRHGLATVFHALASQGINVDVIIQSIVETSQVDVSFTVKDADAERALQVVKGLQDDLGYTDLLCERGLAKVSIVGAGMISNPGVAAQMFQVLAELDITIKMVSTSEIKVSCIIDAALVDVAVHGLHEHFMAAVLTATV